jgi:acetoin utilization deacetylase AcuC-like enzyme
MIGIVSNPVFMDHDTGSYHPETPVRIQYLHTLFCDPDPQIHMVEPVKAAVDDILLNHHRAYIDLVKRACEAGSGHLDPDTAYSAESYATALLAAGSLIRLCEMAIEGEITSGFAFVRPPGHHSVYERAMGFCLFNNVAIAARKARETFGIQKVLIIDFDVHHGNGTQDSFYRDDSVLYFSTHQYPFYPGTGSLYEKGEAVGEGFTVNCPLGYGKTDGQYMSIYRYVLSPIIQAFKPGLILVSAGFDAHAMDPIGGMQLSSACYGAIAGVIRQAAELVGAPVVYTLEGGYNLEAQRESAAHIIRVLKGENMPDITPVAWPEIDNIMDAHADKWPI